MIEVLDAALEYRRLGWSVIPVSRGTKKPLISWAEFQTRLPSEEEIHRWWDEYPQANVAVITGGLSGIVVVDIDPKRGGSAKKIDADNRSSLIVQTGSGGHHLYYKHPGTRIRNQVGRRTGVDVRGDGGYVVVPPSLHASGRRYEWKRGDGAVVLTAPPAFVLTPITNGSEPVNKEPWLSDMLQGVAAGGRNDACARLAGYYVGKGIPRDVILQQLLTWNTKNSPPLSEKEIEITVDSVHKTAQSRKIPAPKTAVSGVELEEPFALTPLADFMVQFGETAIKWDIENWLPSKTIAMIVAPPGTFKTWLNTDLAVSIASGTPFLGHYPILKKGPVLLIQQEDFHGQTAQRIAVVTSSRFPDLGMHEIDGGYEFNPPPNLPIYIHPDRRFRFSDSAVLEALRQKVEDLRPALVILDPLYSAADLTDYMAKAVQDMFFFKELRDLYGCSFLIAHHTGKRSETSNREDAWGSQFINAFIETGWQLRPTDREGVATIRRHFKTRKNIEEAEIKFNITTEGENWNYAVALSEKNTTAGKYAPKMDFTSLIADNGPMQASEIADIFHVDRSTVTRRLGKLLETGGLIRLDDGRYDINSGPVVVTTRRRRTTT